MSHQTIQSAATSQKAALNVLQGACLNLQGKGIQCTVEKPIYDWGETGTRPDFVVTGAFDGNAHTVLVETMGFSDPEYAQRKKTTLAKLAGYVVFEDLRHQHDPQVDQKLMRCVMGSMLGRLCPSPPVRTVQSA